MQRVLCLWIISILFVACREEYAPKPYGFFRIDFPEKHYHLLKDTLPFSFQISDLAIAEPDRAYDAEPYWINISYPQYNAKISITYKPVITDTSLISYFRDSHQMAYKHTVKAEAINEKIYHNRENGTFGLLYNIEGNTASPSHFFITDSTHHFLRGSLHFNERPNRDSLSPIINFIKEDIRVIMETLKF